MPKQPTAKQPSIQLQTLAMLGATEEANERRHNELVKTIVGLDSARRELAVEHHAQAIEQYEKHQAKGAGHLIALMWIRMIVEIGILAALAALVFGFQP